MQTITLAASISLLRSSMSDEVGYTVLSKLNGKGDDTPNAAETLQRLGKHTVVFLVSPQHTVALRIILKTSLKETSRMSQSPEVTHLGPVPCVVNGYLSGLF